MAIGIITTTNFFYSTFQTKISSAIASMHYGRHNTLFPLPFTKWNIKNTCPLGPLRAENEIDAFPCEILVSMSRNCSHFHFPRIDLEAANIRTFSVRYYLSAESFVYTNMRDCLYVWVLGKSVWACKENERTFKSPRSCLATSFCGRKVKLFGIASLNLVFWYLQCWWQQDNPVWAKT